MNIDLDVIRKKYFINSALNNEKKDAIDNCMKEAIKQALILASEKAKAVNRVEGGMIWPADVDKQSILDIEKLIK